EHVLEASLPGHRSQRVAFRDAPPRRTTWTLERVPSAVLLRGVPAPGEPPMTSARANAPSTPATEAPPGAETAIRYGANHALITR
ncbi:MAG: hypothetical protein JWN48_2392, partial [Myxococcaceae bacterium]|nr:hypothetical protein [Myxococcaceae bacterium]